MNEIVSDVITRNTISNEQEKQTVKLRKQKLSYRAIGKEVKLSHESVRTILIGYGLDGEIKYPELDDPATFYQKSDEEIAQTLGVKVWKVSNARRELKIKKTYHVDMGKRRNEFAQFLFGDEFIAGKSFGAFVRRYAGKLDESRKNNIIGFYVKGTISSRAKNANNDSLRTARPIVRRLFRDSISKLDISKLIEKEVIIKTESEEINVE